MPAQSLQTSTYPESVSPVKRRALWIEVRDSQTGERRIEHYEAPIPKSRTDRERFLNRCVPAIYPGAELRSYAGGAGTFVSGALLITAHYGAVREDTELRPIEEQPSEPVAEDLGQGELFAA